VRNTPGQNKNSFPLTDPKPSEDIGKTITQGFKLGIGKIGHLALSAEPADRQMVTARAIGVVVNCLISNVQTLALR
jgi:hypothetical protein